MDRVKIQIILLGEQRHQDLFELLKKYRSDIFEITDVQMARLPQADLENWGYSDSTIGNILSKRNNVKQFDICLSFIDYPIEDNYFSRVLDNKTCVCSFYETRDIFENANIDLFNYILGMLYVYSADYIVFDNLNEQNLFHDERRGCLFDMCGLKDEIIYKYSSPILCYDCEAKMRARTVDVDFFSILRRELKRFNKPLFYRIVDFIKKRPILSVIITALITICLNLLSSILYDLIK